MPRAEEEPCGRAAAGGMAPASRSFWETEAKSIVASALREWLCELFRDEASETAFEEDADAMASAGDAELDMVASGNGGPRTREEVLCRRLVLAL